MAYRIALALGCCLLTNAVVARPATAAGIDPFVSQRIDAIHRQLESEHDFAQAAADAQALFDFVVGYAPTRTTRPFVEAAFLRRLTAQLATVSASQARSLYELLRANDDLARELAFAVTGHDKPAEVYGVLAKLHAAKGETVAKYPPLTAALCVVHDKPLRRRINENQAQADDVVALFDFYVDNERKMLFGLTAVPTELMVWVVDSTAKVGEMQWALEKYANDRNVGARFFDIKYDYNHLRQRTPKKVTQLGFTLPNIHQHGGVCADQAYFAMAVGKSIGAPTAYVVGHSAEVGHAWVGFLQARGRQGVWNFDVGRYDAYQGVRGHVNHPRTRQTVPDSYVSLLAELIGTRANDRHTAVAMTDAALRVRELSGAGEFKPDYLAPLDGEQTPQPVRGGAAADQLSLIEAGLRANVGYADGWFAVRDLAEAGKLSLGQAKAWASLVQRLTGRKYPDFTLTMLKPMIANIDNPHEQSRLWDSAFKLFTRRKDLAAEVRLAQGELWQKMDEPRKAGQRYEDVIRRFVNDGPFVITALKRTEAMLRQTGKADRVPQLYEQTWRRTARPQQMAGTFMTQSNWYRIGMLYAAKLKEAGDADEAANIEAEIRGVVGR